jgi:hypothetical protein
MFYANKGIRNDDWTHIPFDKIETAAHRNIFYKFFKLPENKTEHDILNYNRMTLMFPWHLGDTFKERYPSILNTNVDIKGSYTLRTFLYDKMNSDGCIQVRKYLHKVLNQYLIPTESFSESISEDIQKIQHLQSLGKRVLCIMVRWPLHYLKLKVDDDTFIRNVYSEISDTIKEYDFILPITQVSRVYEHIKNTYGNKCINIQRKRLGNEDWRKDVSDSEFEDEIRFAITDIYLASTCSHILFGPSNMAFCAMILNPTLPVSCFKILEGTEGG